MYDVLNVLESVNVVSRKGMGKYVWHGMHRVVRRPSPGWATTGTRTPRGRPLFAAVLGCADMPCRGPRIPALQVLACACCAPNTRSLHART